MPHPRRLRTPRSCLSLAALVLGVTGLAGAQPRGQMPPAPVGYTEARTYSLRRAIALPGTVDARVSSLVAAEVGGLIEELLVREGQAVAKGQPLARLRQTNLELQLKALEGQLREAEARQSLARQRLDRLDDLLEQKVISRQEYDDARFELEALLGRFDQLTAQRDQIRDDIARSVVRAPFGGVVVAERTQVGQWVGAGDPVVELMGVGDLEVNVEAPERYFPVLTRGTAATVRFPSVPGVEIEGQISAVVPRADPQARTFPLKVRFPNRGHRVGVGMLAQVSFQAGDAYDAIVVPKDAVVDQGGRKLVFVINDDGSVAPVPVETTGSVGAWTGVEGPVRPGQKVVTRGNERLRPGQPVQGQPQEYKLP